MKDRALTARYTSLDLTRLSTAIRSTYLLRLRGSHHDSESTAEQEAQQMLR